MVSLSFIRRNRRVSLRKSQLFEKDFELITIQEEYSCRDFRPTEGGGGGKIDKNQKRVAPAYDLINQARSSHSLPALNRSELLENLAKIHATHMARELTVTHSVQNATQLKKLLRCVLVGENVQKGTSCQSMHETTMNETTSADHKINRDNILGNGFSECGVATVVGRDCRRYTCQYFR
jgi:uncharacterized protein YkwD